MKAAPIPDDEKLRLENLKKYEVLDTTPEKFYDDITKLVANIFSTPVALVSLIDRNRQWFKSSFGLDAKETPRSVSFCGHAILNTDVLVVENSLEDERFKDNPLCTDAPKVIAYAGAPLITPSGHRVGTLCAIDHHPRKFSVEQIESLRVLANTIVSQFELRKKNRELINSQEQLLHSQRLATIGQLAAGVGHEINNPLAVITGLLGMIKRNGNGLDEKVKKHLSNIESASLKIKDIVAGLRNFSKTESSEIKSFDLGEVVGEAISMVKDVYVHEGFAIHYINNCEFKAVVDGNERKVAQVLLNLIKNAKESMVQSDKKNIEILLNSHEDTAILTVKDYGHGICEENQAKVFEPFFTSKAPSEGTGLGLSVVHSIIMEFGGAISFKSIEGEGTKFKVTLPLAHSQICSEELKESLQDDCIKGNDDETLNVLIADDEEGVREVLSDLVDEMGGKSKVVENGKLAYEEILKNPGQFDVLLSDIQMPEMSGIELVERLTEKGGATLPKLVLITGGVNNDGTYDEINKKVDCLLFKPFSFEDLCMALNDIVSEKED